MAMTFGCAAWGFRETPLEQQLAITRELGLDQLELGVAGHENDFLQIGATPEQLAQVREWFKRYGVKLESVSTGNDFTQADAAACRADLKNVQQVTEIAAALGARIVRLFAGFSPAEEVTDARWKQMTECLAAAVEFATRRGVTLAVETHGGVKAVPGGIAHFHSTSTRRELLLRWLEALPSEAKLLFDPANLGAVGMNEAEILALYRELCPRIAVFHLKDFKPVSPTALAPCACGEGQLDWSKLMSEFRAFDGVGFLEYEITGDIVDGLKRTLKAIR